MWKARGGRGLRLKQGEMNQTEGRYARDVLEPAKQRGEILGYWFEAVTFKVAEGVRYTPDFLVQESDGYFRLDEVKGATSKKKKCWRCDGSGEVNSEPCPDCKGKKSVITGTHAYIEPQDRVRIAAFADRFPIKIRAAWERRQYEGEPWGYEDFTGWTEPTAAPAQLNLVGEAS